MPTQGGTSSEPEEWLLRLDPYIRARTIYDRYGMIKEGGLLNFYPNISRHLKASTDLPPSSGIPRPDPHADDVD
jgi:hypothetical protein